MSTLPHVPVDITAGSLSVYATPTLRQILGPCINSCNRLNWIFINLISVSYKCSNNDDDDDDDNNNNSSNNNNNNISVCSAVPNCNTTAEGTVGIGTTTEAEETAL